MFYFFLGLLGSIIFTMAFKNSHFESKYVNKVLKHEQIYSHIDESGKIIFLNQKGEIIVPRILNDGYGDPDYIAGRTEI